MAICSSAGVKLLHTIPASGFEVDWGRFVPGPSAVASVTFTSSWIGVVLKVTCSAGVPVEHVYSWPLHHHDE